MTRIMESRAFAEAATPAEGTGALDITIATPGWGSSGYYSPDVLEAAGDQRVFPAGTHMYVNHPTATENYERPVRDLTMLAAVLAEDAVWTGDRLKAKVTTFSNWRKPLAEMAPYIGVSMRAGAEVMEGEAEGRKGTIITAITEGLSVDFVTRAGRGGEITTVLEDAFGAGRAGAPHVATEALSSDIHSALQALLRDGEPSGTWSYIRDVDTAAQTVYFERESGNGSGIFSQGYTVNAEGIPEALSGDSTEVRVATEYVPVAASNGQSTSTESQEDMMPTIEEARLRALEEAEARIPTLLTERDEALARATAAEEALATQRDATNAATATSTVTAVFQEAEINAPNTVQRLSRNYPVTESGEVDVEALRQIASESAAEIAALAGRGSVRGLGGSTTGTDDISESELDERLRRLRGSTTVKEA